MKKIYFPSLLFVLLFVVSLNIFGQSTITINGNSYAINTVETANVGRAAKYFRLNIPAFPLNVSVLEIDVTNPDINIETWSGKDYAAGAEHPQDMSNRKSTEDHKILAAINGDFFGSVPCGAEMILGELSQKVASLEFCTSGDSCGPGIVFSAQNKPVMDVMRFKPFVKHLNGEVYNITNLNGDRYTNYLVLFNAYSGKTNTGTNEWGHEALVSPVGGKWIPDENGDIRCRVEKVRPISPGSGALTPLEIVAGKAVLSGHGLARTFLEKVIVGDEININWGVALENNPQVKSLTNVVSGNMLILKNKIPAPPGTEDREKYKHPRTAAGYTNDKTKVYFVVVDGRQAGVSVGVSTRELADILAYAGADNAINLDGGGSTCMVVNGQIKNIPSERRSVINGLLLSEDKITTNLADETVSADNVEVYPNPADKIVFFKVNLEQKKDKLQINLFNANGQKVKEICQQKNVAPGTSVYPADTSGLESGTYIYEVLQDDNRTSGKLIIK